MRFQKYLLLEKTYAIGADVDLIYKKTFAKYEKIFKKGDMKEFVKEIEKADNLGDGQFGFGAFSSSELKSKQCRIAHDLNPITIQTGLLGGNYYSPNKSVIQVSLNSHAVNLLSSNNVKTIDDLYSLLVDSDEAERFINEFSAASIKGSLYHELSHWINDSKHNFHITKMIKKAEEFGAGVMQRGGTTLFTDYEIDAQVHAIKQLKRHFNKSWDAISWKDIQQFKPSFDAIRRRLTQATPAVQKDYFKRMTKRLHREKLLGKTMQKTFIRDMV